jgi:hypothetical protein
MIHEMVVVAVALNNLRVNDQFTIISFDHRQEYFRPILVAATPENIAAAASWVRSLQPERGGTDIQVCSLPYQCICI